MREILFRGKRKDNGEWVQGDLSQHKTGKKFIKCGSAISSYEVIPETIGQYTGVRDRSGKKVFEGDIVEYRYPLKKGGYKPFRAEVKAGQESFGAYHSVYGFCAYLEFGDIENSNVIGNIHDNPELLKEGAEE